MLQRVIENTGVRSEPAGEPEVIELSLEQLAQVGGGIHHTVPITLPVVGPT
jgi:hypothetical protein